MTREGLMRLLLSGCTSSTERALNDCMAYGYKRGTPEFAACAERQATGNREARARAWSEAGRSLQNTKIQAGHIPTSQERSVAINKGSGW